MANSTLSVDTRIINPLVCNPDDDLTRWPADTLHRIAITLNLLSGFISDWPGTGSVLDSDNDRFAFAMQLDGMASVLSALADALTERVK